MLALPALGVVVPPLRVPRLTDLEELSPLPWHSAYGLYAARRGEPLLGRRILD